MKVRRIIDAVTERRLRDARRRYSKAAQRLDKALGAALPKGARKGPKRPR